MVFELVNPGYQQLFPGRRPLLEALPELAGPPVWRSLRRVCETSQTHEEREMLVSVARHEGGLLEDFYFYYIQQARCDEQGRIDGLMVFALDITDQTRTRQEATALQAEVLATARRPAQEREAFYTRHEVGCAWRI